MALLLEQPAVVLCWRGLKLLGGLTMDEHSEHKDLCGSGHQSVIPYIHRRDGCCIIVCLLKSRLSLLEVSLVWSWSSKEHV
jgi:hypothetical protein